MQSNKRSAVSVAMISTGEIRIPPTGYGGVERHVTEIAKSLTYNHARVLIFDRRFGKSDRSDDKVGDIPIFRVPGPGYTFKLKRRIHQGFLGFGLEKLAQIPYAIKVSASIRKSKHRFDIVHFHSTFVGLIVFLLAGRKETLVYTIHSVLHSPEHRSVGIWSRVNVVLDIFLVEHVRHVITVNPSQREVFVKRYKINGTRVSYVPTSRYHSHAFKGSGNRGVCIQETR